LVVAGKTSLPRDFALVVVSPNLSIIAGGSDSPAIRFAMKRLRTTAGGGSGWSALPGDLLEQISGYLSTDADRLHIHQVCAPWRACTPSPTAFRPWILARWTARSPPPAPSSCNYSVWLPRCHLQQEVPIGAPPAGAPYCCGASRGWLALTDNASSPTRLVLWDPASGAEVRLPPLPGVTRGLPLN